MYYIFNLGYKIGKRLSKKLNKIFKAKFSK